MKLVVAVTTYNRLDYLKEFIKTWNITRGEHYDWTFIIADDGSNSEIIDFINKVDLPNKILIKSNRRGMAYNTNCIFKELNKIDYEVCFKCDDDLIFLDKGWDDLYVNAILNTPFKHLCCENELFNEGDWCKEGRLMHPSFKTINGMDFWALVRNFYAKGCFYTLTPEVLDKVGYMDVDNFFHGYEHIDYTLRCARAGFNDKELIYDCLNGKKYIGYRFPWQKENSALKPINYVINGNGNFSNVLKRKVLKDENRCYIEFKDTKRRMRSEILL